MEPIFQNIITSVQLSLNTNNWYGALFVTLAVPDICGSIEYPEVKSVGERYSRWFDCYAGHYYKKDGIPPFMVGDDCYSLRCAMFHEGRTEISGKKRPKNIDDFLFLATGSGFNLHCNRVEGNKLALDIPTFCNEMMAGFTVWVKSIEGDAAKLNALNGTLHIRDLSSHTPFELFNMFFGKKGL